jgi:signal transduction histidine kinase
MADERAGTEAEAAAAAADDHARLEGARLAARGIAHCINNDLTGALGNLSLVLLAHPDLTPEVRQRLQQSTSYLQRASAHLDQFQHIRRVVARETPGGLILDLDASLQSDPL